jgi:subtilisin family serine protease
MPNFTILENSDDISISETGEIIDWSLQSIHIDEAWKYSRGNGVMVGVIDTGVSDHPDLAENTVFRTGEPDTNGHGSHVAGIIGASKNGTGMIGVAPECMISMIHAIPGDQTSISQAIDTAIDQGCDIINMSLGCDSPDTDTQEAIRRAINWGTIIVAAAGNNPSAMCYPAMYDEVIAVTALDGHHVKASFASDMSEKLSTNHFAMPGVNVLSCWLNGQYARLSGTSQAAPILSGVIALILSLHRTKRSDRRAFVNSELIRISSLVPGTCFREPEGNLL